MKYRGEIDGLRALAVLPVILFHAGFETFKGGFVGVDVFFVISGYLITSIILGEMERGSFKLIHFYERRVRRILPPLFLIMSISLVFAWLWIMPRDLQDFGQSLVASTLFSSNILFWLESGYFDTSAELKPLLHTWSLAVEEQYYIIFPVFIMAVWRYGQKAIVSILLLVFVASLGLAHWGAYIDHSATFYLLPTRMWELAIGALVAFYLAHKPQQFSPLLSVQMASILGLALIVFAIFAYDEHTPYPSLYALAPTLGTALIILFSVKGSATHFLLNQKMIVGMGLLSYSAYLWHQPIFALARYKSATELSDGFILLLCAIVLPLSYLSWRFVENPFRQKNLISRKTVFSVCAIFGAAFITIGLFIDGSHGFRDRFPFTSVHMNFEAVYDVDYNNDLGEFPLAGNGKWEEGFSIIPHTAEPRSTEQRRKVLLIGDSHAEHLRGLGAHLAHHENIDFYLYKFTNCPPLLGYHIVSNINAHTQSPRQKACQKQVKIWEDFITEFGAQFDYVILGGHWNGMFDEQRLQDNQIKGEVLVKAGASTAEPSALIQNSRANFLPALRETVTKINQAGPKVIFVAEVPHLKRDALVCVLKPDRNACALPDIKEVKRRGKFVHDTIQASDLFDNQSNYLLKLEDYFCSDETQKCKFMEGDVLYYKDASHLSDFGAAMVAKAWKDSPSYPQW